MSMLVLAPATDNYFMHSCANTLLPTILLVLHYIIHHFTLLLNVTCEFKLRLIFFTFLLLFSYSYIQYHLKPIVFKRNRCILIVYRSLQHIYNGDLQLIYCLYIEVSKFTLFLTLAS